VQANVVRAVVIDLVLVVAFVFFFVFPGHDPKPRGVPVGVAGPQQAVAPAAAALSRARGGEAFEVERFPGEDEARKAIVDREIYGAYLPASGRALIATAASPQVAEGLRGAFAAAARARGGGLQVEDLRPLDSDDPRGVSVNLTMLPLTVTGILSVLILAYLAPALDARRRFVAIVMFAVLGGLAAMAIVRVAIGALPGSFAALAAVAALALLAIATVSAGIIRFLSGPGVGLSFGLFLMLGNPASGAASAPELLPGFWQAIGPYLPPGALAGAIRNVAYFDGAGLARPLVVLTVYVLAGGALLLLADARAPTPSIGLAPPGREQSG
jgi:hypothetical protein